MKNSVMVVTRANEECAVTVGDLFVVDEQAHVRHDEYSHTIENYITNGKIDFEEIDAFDDTPDFSDLIKLLTSLGYTSEDGVTFKFEREFMKAKILLPNIIIGLTGAQNCAAMRIDGKYPIPQEDDLLAAIVAYVHDRIFMDIYLQLGDISHNIDFATPKPLPKHVYLGGTGFPGFPMF
jgi:hypothetical protein